MIFSEALRKVLKEEGGYVDDPLDSGGATNRGVTQNTYNLYRKRKGLEQRPVRQATMIETEEIYHGIWKSCKADKLPTGVNVMHFDFAVNAGNVRAAKTLQAVLDVEQDGKIGPVTLAAVALLPPKEFITDYAEARRVFYNSLASRRPKDKKFLRGWLLRTNRCESTALKALEQSAP
jgi:lysozyme family protein